ncbi:MAG TPA: sulfotransferase family protein [Thermoanaerobaculia bacterium]|nr:sulfotransferase family protein [Thermoanaerobaculia bacterium]
MLRINLWSGPRNVSTALMYSFAQRSDTRVVDEPLYAHYLRVSGAEHPGCEEVLASQEQDGERVVREVILGDCDRAVLFAKQMAHHLVALDRSFLARCANVLLTRDPREVLPSLAQNLATPTLRDTGYAVLTELLDQLDAIGQDPPVLDGRELLRDPRAVLGELCRRLGIGFEEAMLSWSPGGRPEDGVWAPHWYAGVHRSSGFEPYAPKNESFPAPLRPLLEECTPHYQRLSARAIRAEPGVKATS